MLLLLKALFMHIKFYSHEHIMPSIIHYFLVLQQSSSSNMQQSSTAPQSPDIALSIPGSSTSYVSYCIYICCHYIIKSMPFRKKWINMQNLIMAYFNSTCKTLQKAAAWCATIFDSLSHSSSMQSTSRVSLQSKKLGKLLPLCKKETIQAYYSKWISTESKDGNTIYIA